MTSMASHVQAWSFQPCAQWRPAVGGEVAVARVHWAEKGEL